MKNAITSLLMFCVIFAAAQTKKNKADADDGYKLQGKLQGAANAKIYLIETAFYKDVRAKDSTIANNEGEFSFYGRLSEPSYYMVEVQDKNGALGLILENTQITITGKADSVWNAKVTGSKENDIKAEAEKLVMDKSFMKLYEDADNLLKQATEKKDTLAITLALKQKKEVEAKDMVRLEKFMNKYPTSMTSVNFIAFFIGFSAFNQADSILKVMEASAIAKSGQVKYFRDQVNALKQLSIGKLAPNFTQTDTLGNPITLSSFKGKYVLIDFWASWCGPCRQENPAVSAIYSKYNHKKFEVISVSLDNNKANWISAIRKDKLRWTQTSDLKGWKNTVALLYAVSDIPQTYLINPDGKIIAAGLHGEELDRKLDDVLK